MLGLIIGFAARPVLANFVAGVLMAIRQPIRIGDLISIGEEVHGRVNDIALTYTSVDRGDGSLLVIPNEKVITEVVVNHSAGNRRAPGDGRGLGPARRRRRTRPRGARGDRGHLDPPRRADRGGRAAAS